jgi:hypothetical protein
LVAPSNRATVRYFHHFQCGGTKIPRQDHGVTRWFDPFCPEVISGVGCAAAQDHCDTQNIRQAVAEAAAREG